MDSPIIDMSLHLSCEVPCYDRETTSPNICELYKALLNREAMAPRRRGLLRIGIQSNKYLFRPEI